MVAAPIMDPLTSRQRPPGMLQGGPPAPAHLDDPEPSAYFSCADKGPAHKPGEDFLFLIEYVPVRRVPSQTGC